MTVERVMHILAGLFIMVSVVLASVFNGVELTQPTWLWFTLFVGVNLFQSGFSQWCMLGIILRKLGLKSNAESDKNACKTC